MNAFLSLYYHQIAALADRGTYTFWEHYFGASPHKTHEEGWFLMQTRWMLWLEHGETLNLQPAVPRAWLKDGKCIELERVATAGRETYRARFTPRAAAGALLDALRARSLLP